MKARKKPILVDVIQLPELNYENIKDYDEEVYDNILAKGMDYIADNRPGIFWCSNEFDNRRISMEEPITYWYTINTLEGSMKAYPGDYLVYGGNDDIRAIKKEIFEATYELVDDEKALEEHINAVSEERQELIDELIYMIVDIDPGSSISTYFNFRGNEYYIKISELPEDKDK